MAATVTSVAASPTTVTPGGGTSTITPVISNPDSIATVTVSVDGSTGTAAVTVHEPLVFSINAADIGKRGFVIATVDQGGAVAVGADGVSFVFTSA